MSETLSIKDIFCSFSETGKYRLNSASYKMYKEYILKYPEFTEHVVAFLKTDSFHHFAEKVKMKINQALDEISKESQEHKIKIENIRDYIKT